MPVIIAEGQGRLSKGEFRQFPGQARGSLIEMETQIVIAGNLGFLNPNTVAELIDRSGEVSRLLHGLIKSLQPVEPKSKISCGTSFLLSRNQKPETGNQKLRQVLNLSVLYG